MDAISLIIDSCHGVANMDGSAREWKPERWLMMVDDLETRCPPQSGGGGGGGGGAEPG